MSPGPIPTQIGRYRVIRRIATGGMGSLYLAHDPAIDRQVAIKVLLADADNSEFRERFAREAQSAGRLHHPNIVSIFDVGEHDGEAYIVMEFVSGETLAQLIANATPLTLSAKLAIAESMCAGLGYAHEQQVVHRDIKPANVMVADDGAVKILDFGIASLAHLAESGLTKGGAVFGTLNYLSPEMVQGRAVDYRADIFALGSVVYELLAGVKLFPGTLSDGLLHRIMTGDHRPLSVAAPELPVALDGILERSIATDPAERYQDLRSMARDLAQCRLTLSEASSIAERTPPPAAASRVPVAFEPTLLTVTDAAASSAPVPGEIAPDATVFLSPPAGDQPSDPPHVPDVRLLVGRSPDPHQVGRVIPFVGPSVTLGRDPDCDIAIQDDGWSRHHARLEWQNGGFVIHDLGSTNGTFVNGRRVRKGLAEPLFFGATIDIAGTRLTFSYGRDTTLPDLTGADLAGRYRLHRLLKESAKAAVYAATDRNVSRDVAIKVLSPELARYPGYRERFEREARTAAALQHPHICQVLDSGVTRLKARSGDELETAFLCFELMAGGSLTQKLAAKNPVHPEDVSRWIQALGAALDYAHRQGVLHGDLKPSAIVFDSVGNLYLTDFAIALQPSAAGERPIMGSPAFMAPEHWSGEAVGPPADQFAMAARAYYLSAGSLPFEGQDSPEIREKNFRRGPIPAHEEAAQNGRPPVSRAVSEVIGRGLKVDPADRFTSVEAFTRALLKALGTGHVAGKEPLVFVSYDRELSGGWARFFADRLKEKHHIRVFMDTIGLDKAGRFPPRLKRAIEDCDVFICFLARQSLESKWVMQEIGLAHEFGKTMIPIFQESYVEPSLPEDDSPLRTLISHQGIKLFDVSGFYVEHAVTDLARLVHGVMNGDADTA